MAVDEQVVGVRLAPARKASGTVIKLVARRLEDAHHVVLGLLITVDLVLDLTLSLGVHRLGHHVDHGALTKSLRLVFSVSAGERVQFPVGVFWRCSRILPCRV